MSSVRWRYAAAAVPLLVLGPSYIAEAADNAPAPASDAKPAAAPSATTTWTEDLLAPLRDFGIESWWDIPRAGTWSGTLSLGLDSQRQRLSTPDSASQRSGTDLARETATLRNDGFSLVDPRFFTGSAAIGFTLEQQWNHADQAEASQQGTLANYAFDGTFLPESPYNLNLFALRNQNTYVLPSSTTTATDNQYQGVTLRLRENSILRDREILPYFSANLMAQQQQTRQTTRTGLQTFHVDDDRDQLTFDFHNGGLTSDLNFQYQYTQLTNHVYPQGSFDSQSANLVYSLDFGPTLNRRWDSRVNYYSRTGESPVSDLTTLEVNEFLTIDHNVDRSSNYSYQLTRQSTPFGTTTTQNATAQLNQQIYSNFGVSGGLIALYTALPDGTVNTLGGNANLNYSRRLPWEGSLTLNAGGADAVTTSKVPGGLVPVRDAPYTVPQVVGAGSGILLADRNIETATIVVVVIKAGGARVAATVNVDYTVDVVGDRTRILPLPSSAVMLPGDPLNISYIYRLPPDSKFQTTSRSLSLGIDWPMVGFNFSHDESDQKPLSGSTALLVDQRRDAGNVYIAGNWDDLRGRAGVGVVRYDSTSLQYLERRADEFLYYRPFLNLSVALAASQYRTDYELPAHATSGNTMRVDVTWTWSGNWLTSAYAGTRTYRDSQQPTETIDEAGFRIRRTWSLLDLNLLVGSQYRKRGDPGTLNSFLHLGLIRRF